MWTTTERCARSRNRCGFTTNSVEQVEVVSGGISDKKGPGKYVVLKENPCRSLGGEATEYVSTEYLSEGREK